MKQSMIVPHPLWDEVKLTKKDKDDWEKVWGVKPTKMVAPNKKYYELMERILIGDETKHHSRTTK